MLTTVPVHFIVYDQNGSPAAGAVVRAKLDQTEIYGGFVVPELVEAIADDAGEGTLNLWPNALGVAGSMYRVTATNPDTGRKFLDATASVPDSPCELHQILVQEPYPAIDVAAQALIAAQGALADVTAQAQIATSRAGEAGASAANAAQSESDAAVHAAESSDSAALARQWAEADPGVQVEAGRYSAKHWADQAKASKTGELVYRGPHSALAGLYPPSPTLGDYYRISESGSLDGVFLRVGDVILYNGDGWDKNRYGASGSGGTSWEDLDKPLVIAAGSSAAEARTAIGLGDSAVKNTGTTAGTVAAGDDARFTDSRAPSGGAGGVLSGTFPNPGFSVDMATQAELDAAIATRIATSARGAASGVASLDAGGKVPESQMPAVVISDVFPVASEAAMLALTAERGDIAIRSDVNKTFALSAEPASTLGNWLELRSPTSAVLSVAGKTGAVTLVKADVGLGSVDNTADAAKPVSTATQTALDAKAPLASPTFTGTVSGITKAMVGLSSVDNTADAAKPISTATQAALDAKAPLTETVYAITDGGSVALNPANGTIQTWTLGASRTPTASFTSGQGMTLMVDDGTAYTITWTTAAITWLTADGNPPTLKTTGYTAIVLWKVGSVIYGK